jgi:hypothetical protein
MLCCRQSEKKPAKAPQKYGRGLEPKTGKKCSGFPERRSASGNYGLSFPLSAARQRCCTSWPPRFLTAPTRSSPRNSQLPWRRTGRDPAKPSGVRRASHSHQHRMPVAYFKIAVARHRLKREIFRVAMIAQIKDPGKARRGKTLQDVKTKLAPSRTKRSDREAPSEGQASSSPSSWRPRAGSKQALLISLLMSAEGASLDKIVAATGWLPYTVRAALTGLRKRGYAIGRLQETGGKSSTYRIVTNAQPLAA